VRELEDRAQRWRPWRGYATIHLWHAAAELGARAPRGAPARAASAAPAA
jgi:3-methyladenine DNA glycosylase/8-oxoguanine DNA glycosylase